MDTAVNTATCRPPHPPHPNSRHRCSIPQTTADWPRTGFYCREASQCFEGEVSSHSPTQSLVLQMVKCLTTPAKISQAQSCLSQGLGDWGCSTLFSPSFASIFPWWKKNEVDESDCALSYFPLKYKPKLKLSKDCAVFIWGINSNIRILLIGEDIRFVPKWQTSQYQNNPQNIKI